MNSLERPVERSIAAVATSPVLLQQEQRLAAKKDLSSHISSDLSSWTCEETQTEVSSSPSNSVTLQPLPSFVDENCSICCSTSDAELVIRQIRSYLSRNISSLDESATSTGVISGSSCFGSGFFSFRLYLFRSPTSDVVVECQRRSGDVSAFGAFYNELLRVFASAGIVSSDVAPQPALPSSTPTPSKLADETQMMLFAGEQALCHSLQSMLLFLRSQSLPKRETYYFMSLTVTSSTVVSYLMNLLSDPHDSVQNAAAGVFYTLSCEQYLRCYLSSTVAPVLLQDIQAGAVRMVNQSTQQYMLNTFKNLGLNISS